MSLQHRIRRIAIGLALMFFALCALVPGMYLMAILIFVPGLYLTLSGCLDEFPDDAPQADAETHKPWYSRPWVLLLFSAVPVAAMILCASWLFPAPTEAKYIAHPTPISTKQDPATWETEAANDEPVTTADAETSSTAADQQTYILNTSTKVFHRTDCSSVEKMNEENKTLITAARDEIIADGYSACGTCNP